MLSESYDSSKWTPWGEPVKNAETRTGVADEDATRRPFRVTNPESEFDDDQLTALAEFLIDIHRRTSRKTIQPSNQIADSAPPQNGLAV
jgi:hypothetical protein